MYSKVRKCVLSSINPKLLTKSTPIDRENRFCTTSWRRCWPAGSLQLQVLAQATVL
jgi:hypothetical protein